MEGLVSTGPTLSSFLKGIKILLSLAKILMQIILVPNFSITISGRYFFLNIRDIFYANKRICLCFKNDATSARYLHMQVFAYAFFCVDIYFQ